MENLHQKNFSTKTSNIFYYLLERIEKNLLQEAPTPLLNAYPIYLITFENYFFESLWLSWRIFVHFTAACLAHTQFSA